jgi:small-conductance mechanosensitive channel
MPCPALQRDARPGNRGCAAASGRTEGLARLTQSLAESSRLAAAVATQVAQGDPGRVAAVLAEAEAARRRAEAAAATASAQAAESSASASAAWEVVDATENSQSAAQSRAEAAEKDARNFQAKNDDLTRQLETAVQRARAAESQATEVAAQRDAARQDSEHAAATLTRERHEAERLRNRSVRKQTTRSPPPERPARPSWTLHANS